MQTLDSNLASQWSFVGAMFFAPPTTTRPDLERLLLETARQAASNSRLFFMAVSWLTKHGDRVDALRLARLIRDELEPDYSPVMGALLDFTHSFVKAELFAEAIAECKPAPAPQPLFDVERSSPARWRLAEKNASPISRRWNRWVPDFEPKDDAIRAGNGCD